MKKDYEILGVPEGAKQKDIKRAYFKLVRQFSPEKDPERFQEIRGAYERLTKEEQKEGGNVHMEMPDNSFAHTMMRQINEQMQQGDYANAVDTCQEAIYCFGEYEAFLYTLAVTQLHSGHSGNAVKNFEKLVSRYPEKTFYLQQLAMAYFERGYGKKAYDAFEKAYAAGVRNNDFILQFSICCEKRGEQDRGIGILCEMIRGYDASAKTDVLDYLEAYAGIFSMQGQADVNPDLEILDLYADFLKTAGRKLRDYPDEIADLTTLLIRSFGKPEYIGQLNGILEDTKKPLPEKTYSDEWKMISECFLETRIRLDERLDKEWTACYAAFYSSFYFFEKYLIHHMQLEEKLFLLERREELYPQFEIIRTEYSELYQKMKDFFVMLEQGNISYIQDKLRKEYAGSYRNIGCGRYYEQYPQYKPGTEKVQWDSSEEGVYVRSDKKIGRNDPCPCGSGKKYKQCCGRR